MIIKYSTLDKIGKNKIKTNGMGYSGNETALWLKHTLISHINQHTVDV